LTIGSIKCEPEIQNPALPSSISADFSIFMTSIIRFVIPTGEKGCDYDCAVTYDDGRKACADAKCRIEKSEIRPETIRYALETARSRNLRKDQPGIVFVKVPQTWLPIES
jgi:hypothetical protein